MLKPFHAFHMIISFLFIQSIQAMEVHDDVLMELVAPLGPVLSTVVEFPSDHETQVYTPLPCDVEDLESSSVPQLPKDVWGIIEGFLQHEDRFAFRAVSPLLRAIVNKNKEFNLYFDNEILRIFTNTRPGADALPVEHYSFMRKAYDAPRVRQVCKEELKTLLMRCWLTRFCRGVDRQRITQMAQELEAPVDTTYATTFLSLMAPIHFLKPASRFIIGAGVTSISIASTLGSFFYQHYIVRQANCIFPGNWKYFISFPRTTVIPGQSLTWEYVYYYGLYYGGGIQSHWSGCQDQVRFIGFPSFPISLVFQSVIPGALLLAVCSHQSINWGERFHILELERQVKNNTWKNRIPYLSFSSILTALIASGVMMSPWLIQHNFPNVQTLTEMGQISLDTFRNVAKEDISFWVSKITDDYYVSFKHWSGDSLSYLERLNNSDPEMLPWISEYCLPNSSDWPRVKDLCQVITAPWRMGSFEGSLSTISVTHLGSFTTAAVLALPHVSTGLFISIYIWITLFQILERVCF